MIVVLLNLLRCVGMKQPVEEVTDQLARHTLAAGMPLAIRPLALERTAEPLEHDLLVGLQLLCEDLPDATGDTVIAE